MKMQGIVVVFVLSCVLVSASAPIAKILQPRFEQVGTGACKTILSTKANCPSSFRVSDSWPATSGGKGGSARGTVSSRCEVFEKTHTQNTLFLTREVNEDTMGKYVAAGYIGARGLVDPTSGKIDLKKGGGCYVYTRLVSTSSQAQVGAGSTGSGSPIMLLFGPELLARNDVWAASIDGMGCPPFRVCKDYKKFKDCPKNLMSTLTEANVNECSDKSPGENWGGGKYYPATVDSIAKDNPSINEQGIFGSIPFDYLKAVIWKDGNLNAAAIRSKLNMSDSKYDHIIFKSVTSGLVKNVLDSTEAAKVCAFTQ